MGRRNFGFKTIISPTKLFMAIFADYPVLLSAPGINWVFLC